MADTARRALSTPYSAYYFRDVPKEDEELTHVGPGTPCEPPGSTFKDRLCHGAYPVHEYKGMVFAYMGPPDRKPPFPILDTFELPGFRVEAGPKHYVPCNWLQIKDNSMDPAHTVFL